MCYTMWHQEHPMHYLLMLLSAAQLLTLSWGLRLSNALPDSLLRESNNISPSRKVQVQRRDDIIYVVISVSTVVQTDNPRASG